MTGSSRAAPVSRAPGLGAEFDVVLYTGYAGGKVGDRATFQGRTYVCTYSFAELKLFSSTVDYYEYGLKLVTSGVES